MATQNSVHKRVPFLIMITQTNRRRPHALKTRKPSDFALDDFLSTLLLTLQHVLKQMPTTTHICLS
jgi:hypothetical protein